MEKERHVSKQKRECQGTHQRIHQSESRGFSCKRSRERFSSLTSEAKVTCEEDVRGQSIRRPTHSITQQVCRSSLGTVWIGKVRKTTIKRRPTSVPTFTTSFEVSMITFDSYVLLASITIKLAEAKQRQS